METTLRNPAPAASRNVTLMLFWTVTALFCLQMSFTAYA